MPEGAIYSWQYFTWEDQWGRGKKLFGQREKDGQESLSKKVLLESGQAGRIKSHRWTRQTQRHMLTRLNSEEAT